MKKFILVITILLLTCACSNNLKSIKIDNLEKKLNNKESFVLYLTLEDEEGLTLKKTLKNALKDKDIDLFYINTDKLSDTDEEKLQSLFTYEDSNIVIFIKNGQENSVLSRITDTFISEKDLKTELENQGY